MYRRVKIFYRVALISFVVQEQITKYCTNFVYQTVSVAGIVSNKTNRILSPGHWKLAGIFYFC